MGGHTLLAIDRDEHKANRLIQMLRRFQRDGSRWGMVDRVVEDLADVVSVLNEYLAEVEHAPRIVQQGLKRISRQGFLPSLAGRVIRPEFPRKG